LRPARAADARHDPCAGILNLSVQPEVGAGVLLLPLRGP
jgi:hypothetical protein